jgi:hypothetical protein
MESCLEEQKDHDIPTTAYITHYPLDGCAYLEVGPGSFAWRSDKAPRSTAEKPK